VNGSFSSRNPEIFAPTRNRNRYLWLRPSSKPISKAADDRRDRNPTVS